MSLVTPLVRRLFAFRRGIATQCICWMIFPLVCGASHGSVPAVTMAVRPTSIQIVTGKSVAFEAEFSDVGDKASSWRVDGVVGGSAAEGKISTSGVYTAPTTVPKVAVTVTAISTANPNVSSSGAVIVISSKPGQAFYVSASGGKDTNPGTLALPWRTIQHAANNVRAGDTVYVRSGTYNEAVFMTASGSAAAGYITFENYPGEAPIIDGTGLIPVNGESGLVNITNANFVVVNGFDIRNFKTSSATEEPIGIYVSGYGSCIEILNNKVHNIVTTVTSDDGDALGIAVYGTDGSASINNLIISGNQGYALTTGYSESMALTGNVQFFEVTNNAIHDNDNIGIDVAGFEGTSPTVATDQARDGWITGNTVYNITSAKNPAYGGGLGADGIYVDGGTRVVIERNLVHNVDIGIEMASEHEGRVTSYVTTRDNVIYSANLVGMSIGGYAATVGGTQYCTVANNTLFGDDTTSSGSGELQIQYHASSNIIENNIMDATPQGLLLNNFIASSARPATVNANLYFSSVGSANAEWVWNNVEHNGFTSYVASTGNDKNSLFANPLFVDIGTQNFQVSLKSPAINDGMALGSLTIGNVDFAGNPRVVGGKVDIGAYQAL